MTGKIVFDKYLKSGAYHWQDVDIENPGRFNPVVAARYQFALDLVPQSAFRILDLGCGDGYLAHRLAISGKEVWGMDTCFSGLRAGRIEQQKHSPRYSASLPRLINASGFLMPFRDEAFDCVITTDVIEHVENPERVISEVARVLGPGGVLILSTPNRLPSGFRDPLHVKEFGPDELQDLLSVSFSDVAVRGMGNAAVLNMYKRRSFRKLTRGLVRLSCRFGVNPFMYPRAAHASSATNMLFGLCVK